VSAYIYSFRGKLIENRYRVSLALVNPAGNLLAYAGNPELAAHMRSSAKPFQAQALYQTGAATRFSLTPEELALACASHEGTPAHLAVVQGFLNKLGLGPEYLACGAHWPYNREARAALERAGERPTVLHNNCSGKHTGMLAAALAMGVEPHGYEQPDHPVQQLNLQTLRDLSGLHTIPYGVDGCSVPTFVLPLAPAARMLALLAHPEAAPQKYQVGLEAAFAAMRAHPDLVAGPGAIDTVLMQTVPMLVAKRGADGYYAMALRESRWGPLGIALKIEDGSTVARDSAVVRLLELLGVLSPDQPLEWRTPPVRNVRGLEVGHYEAAFELSWV